ncbi:MAG: transposase [Gemmataceae bacterium]
MVTDVFRCEDAHAQERGLLDSVVATLQERDLGLADRNFCTRAVLLAIVASKACFVIREHANLGWEPAGRVRSRGRIDGARVREQRVAIRDDQDNKVFLRRVALELDEPTRDGDVCIFVLTNLPEEAAGAREVGRLYRQRWTIETTFAEVRSYLGMGTTRGRCQKAVLRAEPRLLGLYGVVTLLYEQLPDEARAVPGVEWDGKETVTFSDAITAVRRWLWASWALRRPAMKMSLLNSPRRCGGRCCTPWHPQPEG